MVDVAITTTPSGGVITRRAGHLNIKLLLFGSTNGGKTCIASRYYDNTFINSQEPSIQAALLRKLVTVHGQQLQLNLWDTTGAERFKALAPIYIDGADGIIVVYSIPDAESLLEARYWLQWSQQFLRDRSSPQAPSASSDSSSSSSSSRVQYLLVGNKCDLDRDQHVISAAQGDALAREFGASFMEVSAKTGYNITMAFNHLLARLPSVIAATDSKNAITTIAKKLEGVASDQGDRVKLVLFGAINGGKTCIRTRYHDSAFMDQYQPTIMSGMSSNVVGVHGGQYQVDMYDTPGANQFRALAPCMHIIYFFPFVSTLLYISIYIIAYLGGVDGIIVVYAINDQSSFAEARYWLKWLHGNWVNRYTPATPNKATTIQYMLVGNKCDVNHDQRVISAAQGDALAKEFGASFIEVSAKTGVNIATSFDHLLKRIILVTPVIGESMTTTAARSGAVNQSTDVVAAGVGAALTGTDTKREAAPPPSAPASPSPPAAPLTPKNNATSPSARNPIAQLFATITGAIVKRATNDGGVVGAPASPTTAAASAPVMNGTETKRETTTSIAPSPLIPTNIIMPQPQSQSSSSNNNTSDISMDWSVITRADHHRSLPSQPWGTSVMMDWSLITSSSFLRFGRRLGGRLKPINQHMRYDGANGAVFAASLMTPSIIGEEMGTTGSSSSAMNDHPLAVKIIFNVNDLISRDVRSRHDREFQLVRFGQNGFGGRCGDCANVVPVYTHFIDNIDIKQLPQLSDYQDIGARTMFAVMPFIPFSLKSLIESRDLHIVNVTKPLLNEKEVIHISYQMARGLLYLQSKGIVHRDCKPDNVLIRPTKTIYRADTRLHIRSAILIFPSPLWEIIDEYVGWDIAHLSTNILLSSLVAISDLGEHYDAHELKRNDFKMPYLVSGFSKGGAQAYYPPEVALAKPGPSSFIDYSGMDAWALGMCMYAMMATPSSPSLPSTTNLPWTIPVGGLHDSFSLPLRIIVEMLLHPDINNRLTLRDAVTLLYGQHIGPYRDITTSPTNNGNGVDTPPVINSIRYCGMCRTSFGMIFNRASQCHRCWLPCCVQPSCSLIRNGRRVCVWC